MMHVTKSLTKVALICATFACLGGTSPACRSAGSGESTEAEPAASPSPFDPEKEIGAWLAMWNARDLSRLDELFLKDDRLTYFSSEKEGLIRGFEAVREHHQGFGFVEGGSPPDNTLWVEELHWTAYGPTVVVTGIWFFGQKGQDRSSAQHGPMSLVYVRGDDRYRLAHLHFSRYD